MQQEPTGGAHQDPERSARTLSTAVARHWQTPLALLFIDGGHGDEVVRADEAAWIPKVAPGGLVAIHDVFPDPADGGRPPYELFCRLLSAGAFTEDTSLGRGSLRVLRHGQVEAGR